MAEKGQFLEIMVANLQSYLGPEGVEVQLREKFHNEETGKQIGEIDITVRGDFGTSKFFWGIECRDRPADGPQGLVWIRELVGKRRQLKPDKMIAVSSTGFTEDAEGFAQSENIDLITIAEPTEEVLKEWFEIFTITYQDWQCKITGPVTINLADSNIKPPPEMLKIRGDDLIFTIPPFDMRLQSFDSLVYEKVKSQVRSFEPSATTQRLAIEIQAPLSIELGGRVYPLANARTEVAAVPDAHSVRALFNVCRRLSDDQNIALTSTTKTKIKGKDIVFVILAKKNISRKRTMDIRVHFFDELGNQTTLPEGIAMSVWTRGQSQGGE